MSVPLKRMGSESPINAISPKKQKESDDENLTFNDREVEAFLCHLSEEKLVDVVIENNRSIQIKVQ